MTLTETALVTKRSLVIFIILIVLGLTSWTGYNYWYNNIYLPSQPKPEDQADVQFGILPKPPLIPKTASATNYSYSVDTETGSLPSQFPKIIKVYFIPQLVSTLLASDRAREIANDFDFKNGPVILSPTLYRFSDNENNFLTIDLNTGNFNFRRAVASDSAQLATNFGSNEDIIEGFRKLLNQKKLLKDQLRNGRGNVVYNPPDNNTVTVSLWQDDIDGYPVITSDLNNGLIKATINKHIDENKRYQSFEYIFWPIDVNTFGTYPIKNVEDAFNQLKSGGGVVVKEPKGVKVSITNAYLGYLLTPEYNAYIQPIYVFEGPDFKGLVPAISDEYLTK